MIVDCHVNIWNHDQVTSLWREQMVRVRPDGTPGLLADADTLFEAMEDVDKAIVFSIRHDSAQRRYPARFARAARQRERATPDWRVETPGGHVGLTLAPSAL